MAKRRPSGDGMVRKREDGRWEGRIVVGHKDSGDSIFRYRRMKLLLEQAGLPDIRFHDLRHTFATHALTSGVDVKTLSGILGHTRAAFTLDTYTHTTGDMQKRAAEIVGEFLTDIFGEELKPWEESARTVKAQSA